MERRSRTIELRVEPNNGIPNHPHLPALIQPGAFAPEAGVEAIAARFRENGWGGIWHWTVYDFHHFHPASHEVLGVAEGEAVLRLGGPDGPERALRAGDVVVLPAGFGHCRVSASEGFTVVGGYPPGQESPQIVRADAAAAKRATAAIRATPLPRSDPVSGRDGPVTRIWGSGPVARG